MQHGLCRKKSAETECRPILGLISPELEPRSHLQVVRQLLSAGVARVHSDEDGTGWVQSKLGTLKDEPLQFGSDGLLNTLDLLGNHREHLQLNAVELVKTRPRTSLGKTLEELAHSFVVKTIRAVEHHTLSTEHKIDI